MKVYRSLRSADKIPRGCVATIGTFDGVHRGHTYIIKSAVRRARRLGKKCLVITFHPHPFSVLHPGKITPLLISLDHRIELIKTLDADILLLVRFSRRFSKMPPERFIEDVVAGRLGVSEIFVGANFSFGRGGGGDFALLERASKKNFLKVRKVPLLKGRRKAISSTHIRSLIMNGNLKEASDLLGRPVSIWGRVKGGARIGRLLGFSTANIDPHHEAIPPSGVYAVYVKLDNSRHKGVLNIGFRPTFYSKWRASKGIRYLPEPTIEVHILNFKKNIYGEEMQIAFVKRLRPERKFNTKNSLIKRICLDVEAAYRVL